MNRMDEMLTRQFKADNAADDSIAARVLVSIAAKPLPAQRHSLFKGWPNALLTLDFAPAWPRLAALACVGLFGCTVGFFSPGAQIFEKPLAAAPIQLADAETGAVFEPEPLTGARP
jgi:hypothetical protein